MQLKSAIKNVLRPLHPLLYPPFRLLHRSVITPFNRIRNSRKQTRALEIGPGWQRIDGFETLGVVASPSLDYLIDASKPLPFRPESFDLIYASHVVEHIPWYHIPMVLADWVRTLKRGGVLEIWTPNALKIADAFVKAENDQPHEIPEDGWYKFNSDKDPCVWANGRIFSYGDGDGNKSSPNWHLALLSPRYLQLVMRRSGLTEVAQLRREDVRGYDHGWINLGMRGRKP